jgi:GNAT superfamily N-acetyltransferase
VPGRRGEGLTLASRPAVLADVPALTELMDAAIGELQRGFLDEEQIAASRAIMGIDTQLIEDGTYFVVECDGALAGCGGWSRRATLYGSDAQPGRRSDLLDPARDPARIRAFFVHPRWARRGIGRAILERCESEARAGGFRSAALLSTLPGHAFYRTLGYSGDERVAHDLPGGVQIDFIPMSKPLG